MSPLPCELGLQHHAVEASLVQRRPPLVLSPAIQCPGLAACPEVEPTLQCANQWASTSARNANLLLSECLRGAPAISHRAQVNGCSLAKCFPDSNVEAGVCKCAEMQEKRHLVGMVEQVLFRQLVSVLVLLRWWALPCECSRESGAGQRKGPF